MAASTEHTLIFVYNADSGLFNVLADAAHKVLAPDSYRCHLCKVTYGWFSERRAWRDFIAGLGARCSFLHRDEFQQQFPGLQLALPAVLCSTEVQAPPVVCIEAAALNACTSLEALMDLVRERCLARCQG
ncbi:MAG: hypothetical protein EA400_06390 [Chromatiaceae bacterium]|nr:MAG: hypothetical protein EA400_06390 [Chromatiaceae bacterium]